MTRIWRGEELGAPTEDARDIGGCFVPLGNVDRRPGTRSETLSSSPACRAAHSKIFNDVMITPSDVYLHLPRKV